LFGFAKNERDDIDADELATLRDIAKGWLEADTAALVETADDMHPLGLLDNATHDKITMRHRRPEDLPRIAPVTGAQIRLTRARAKK